MRPGSDPARPLDGDIGGRQHAVTWTDSTDGVRLAVRHLGGGTGPPVVAVHANGFHGQVWAPFAALLDHRVTGPVVAPDLRGHGLSEVPPDLAYHWDSFADDVLATVDALGLDRPLGVGHSLGGASLLRAEARRPGTFAAIWCFEPIVFPSGIDHPAGGDNPLALGALRRRSTFASHADAITNFSHKPPLDAFTPEALDAYVRHGFALDPDGSVHLRCRPAVEAAIYRMATNVDTYDRLAEVTCPVVVAIGSVAPYTPASFADRIVAALPDGERHAFDQLGHFGPLEDPAAMAADASTFFGRL